MKIIRLTNKLDFGGVETRFVLTSQYIDLDNFWSFYAIGKGGNAELSIRNNKKQVYCLNLNFKIPSLHVFYKLYKIFLKEKPDIVHTSAAEANFHGLIAATLAGVPVRIGEEIGFPNHDWKWRLIFKWVYKTATKVIAISQSVKDRIVELGEVDEEKVEVVYNPVSIGERFKGENLSRRISGRERGIGEGVDNSDEDESIKDFSTLSR